MVEVEEWVGGRGCDRPVWVAVATLRGADYFLPDRMA